MLSSAGRYCVLLTLSMGIALPLPSQEVPSNSKRSVKPDSIDKKTIPTSKPSTESQQSRNEKKKEPFSLPADAVIVPAERTDDILNFVPNAVILSLSKYQEMRDELDRLKKLVQSE